MQESKVFESAFNEVRLTLTLRVSIPAQAGPGALDGVRESVDRAVFGYALENNMAVGGVLSTVEYLK